MKTLGIVSSWEKGCGIANYTSYLKPELEKYYNVQVLRLDPSILCSRNSNRKKMGDALIDKISKRVSHLDLTNIQFEVGLFGSDAGSVYKRFKKIAVASKNLIVTFHSIRLDGYDISLKTLIKGNPIENFINAAKDNYWPDFYQKIFTLLNQLSKKKNVKVIVHNKRDALAIKQMTNFKNVSDFPLSMYNKEIRNKEKTEQELNNFKSEYHIVENERIIGLFGFVSAYKGHDVVIDALKFLPDNYKIIIFGEQHPSTILKNCIIDPYLKNILNKMQKMDKQLSKLKNKSRRRSIFERVVFAGTVSNDAFIEAMRNVDIVVLPYVEVGQMGSGVAANALECKAKIIMSNNKCFAQLKKYFPDCFDQFDIGNSLELAERILHFDNDYTKNIEKCLEKYNVENNAKNYVNLFEVTK